MTGGQDDTKGLFVTSGVLQELAVELPNHIEVMIDVDVRPDVIADAADDFFENTIRIFFSGLTVRFSEIGVNCNR